MAGSRKFRGLAQPTMAHKPLFVRACEAFVDNLTLILRTAMVFGAVWLVGELRGLGDFSTDPMAGNEPEVPTLDATPPQDDDADDERPVINDQIRHAYNCTFEAYRKAHFESCVSDPSDVYAPPEADPDDSGFLAGDAGWLYATLEPATRADET